MMDHEDDTSLTQSVAKLHLRRLVVSAPAAPTGIRIAPR